MAFTLMTNRITEGTGLNNTIALRINGVAYTSPGLPAAGFLNNVASPGEAVKRLDTGQIYKNTGTLASTIWTLEA
jgi:hypothetical protein